MTIKFYKTIPYQFSPLGVKRQKNCFNNVKTGKVSLIMLSRNAIANVYPTNRLTNTFVRKFIV